MKEIHLETVGSTNTYAKEHVNTFPKDEITCVSADEQTSGRGRFQRTWISPKGVNIYATFCFSLPKTTKHLTSLSQVMAMSLALLLERKKLHPQIKWPNDVRLGQKKLAGILCETQFHRESVDCFLGIGVNVNTDEKTLEKIDQPATSLKQETGLEWDRDLFFKELKEQFRSDLLRFKQDGFGPFHQMFDALLVNKGKEVRCFDGEKIWVGICHSITEDGQLNLQLPDGAMKKILSGDIKS